MNTTIDDGRDTPVIRQASEPVSRRLTAGLVRILVLFVVLVLALGAFTYARSAGWLSPFGIESQTQDTQVVYAIQRTQEVSLLSLGIQGVTEQDASRKFFGVGVPLSDRTLFLQYDFRAKLGLDGSKVQVRKTGAHDYRLTVPRFSFIGYSQPTFKTATESNGLLSFATPDIDTGALVTKILGTSGQQKYLDENRDLLRSQAQVFYGNLITSIDPTARVSYSFTS